MRRVLWLVLLVALCVRLAAIPGAVDNPYGDAADFTRHAIALVETGGYPPTGFAAPGSPSALRPPGYPYLLAGVRQVAGDGADAPKIVHAFLGTLAVGLLYLLVARGVGDRRLALGAAAIAAVLPSLVLIGSGLLSENLFIPLALGAAVLVALYREGPRWWLAAGAGAVLGLAVLTRTNGLALIVPLAIGMWGARGARRRWGGPALAVVALVVVLAPWTIRNAQLFDRFLPLGTQSGFTMVGQWNGVAAAPGPDRAAWLAPPFLYDHRDVLGRPGLDEGEVDAELRSRAIRFAIEHPPVAPTALFLNVQRTFGVHVAHASLDPITYTEMGVPRDRWPWLRWSTYALALLALAGAVVVLRRRGSRGPLWIWLFGLLLFASYVVWLGTPRYRIPVDPFLAILAAAALGAALRRGGYAARPRG